MIKTHSLCMLLGTLSIMFLNIWNYAIPNEMNRMLQVRMSIKTKPLEENPSEIEPPKILSEINAPEENITENVAGIEKVADFAEKVRRSNQLIQFMIDIILLFNKN